MNSVYLWILLKDPPLILLAQPQVGCQGLQSSLLDSLCASLPGPILHAVGTGHVCKGGRSGCLAEGEVLVANPTPVTSALSYSS